jgi:hypothetical protein
MYFLKKIILITFLQIIITSLLLADVTVIGTTKTAYFIDSKVSGLHYQCNNEGILKTTGVDGSFTYDNTCSEITFTLNNKVTLGKILVEDIPANDYKVYVTDLAGTSRTDTTNTYVKNLARLLQSLDSDENPKNGIAINDTNTTLSAMISQFTTTSTLESIVQQTYPTRTLVSETCAIVHLEEVLKDDGFYIDTVAPCKPKLALDINATSNDTSYIELIGERNSTIYLNGANTNLTLDSDGRYYEFELNTTIQRGTFDDFNITFVDATGKISEPLNLHIFNDTDQPFITNFPTQTITTTITSQGIDFNTTDDSITNGLTVSYEVLGADSSEFEITDKGVFTASNGTKYQIWTLTLVSGATTARPLSIQIKVKDKTNHYDIKSLTIN